MPAWVRRFEAAGQGAGTAPRERLVSHVASVALALLLPTCTTAWATRGAEDGAPVAVARARPQDKAPGRGGGDQELSSEFGDVVAVGPVGARPASGAYLHGARFEPPFGRVLHGMGQWKEGNAAYLELLEDPALLPASRLFYIPVGDWPRRWAKRYGRFREALRETVAQGMIPHVDITMYGLDPADGSRRAVDHELAAGGPYDAQVVDVIRAIGEAGGPMFVRIGAEFNGPWNGYTPYVYPAAYRRVVELFRREGVDNVAFVWCYEPSADGDFAERDDARGWRWYPGDDVVDWFALDLFDAAQFSGPTGRRGQLSPAGRTEAFLRMALERGKPVMLAECSAAKVDISPGVADGRRDWSAWFEPFFAFLRANPNVMAFFYVNVDWGTTGDYAQLGWRNARIDRNEQIARRYRDELRDGRYLHRADKGLLNGAFPPRDAGPLDAPPEDAGTGGPPADGEDAGGGAGSPRER